MKIGYSVEGSTDRAIITGFRNRWCPGAQLLEGKFRGQTQTSRRREIPKICQELSLKQVDLIVFLTDSNAEAWREVRKGDAEKCPPHYQHLSVFGVCLRNAECWLAADAGHIAKRFGRNETEFQVDDPKGVVESSFGITGTEKQEAAVAEFVRTAPLHRWMANPSFEDFFDQLWQKSKELGCQIENLRESQRIPTA
jgi:hypothetical protein